MDEDLPVPEQAVLAVLYAPGQRPSLDDVRRAGDDSGAFTVSHDAGNKNGLSDKHGPGERDGPGEEDGLGEDDGWPGDAAGWAELLITGLTFDVSGLSGTPGEASPPVAHRFGFAPDEAVGEGLEAVFLRPGLHLAGAAAMLPVVRGCVALGSALATGTNAAAVVWIPARTAMAPDYFAATIADWLGGGAFPALGLTAVVPDGSGIASEGLAFFTGQEIEVCGTDLPHAGRIAVRLIHTLVGHGPLTASTQLAGPDGEPLLAEPTGDGHRVWVKPRP